MITLSLARRWVLTVAACMGVLLVGFFVAPGAVMRALPFVVVAVSVGALELFVIRLNSASSLTMTPVVALISLAQGGWHAAVIGTALGIASTLSVWPVRHVVAQEVEILGSLAIAALAAALIPLPLLSRTESTVVVSCLAYACAWTLITSLRLYVEHGVAWRRGLMFLATTATYHIFAFGSIAVATVAATTVAGGSHLAAAIVLGALVVLQLYLPRIGRGVEEGRVAAAVSVLAVAVDVKDPYTSEHSIEVADLCRRVARAMTLDEGTAERVHLAGLLHDVGKIGVPIEVLVKPGKLTLEERAVIERHVEDGAAIVSSIEGLAPVVPIVAASHEQLDGSGYPRGLRGQAVPIEARINLVVDAYNALTTNRPYRRSRPREDALAELDRHAGSQFDPNVIAALRKVLRVPAAARARGGCPHG